MGISSAVGLGSKKLVQTSTEQAILRNIQALEEELQDEAGLSRREEIVDQINDLKSGIASVGSNLPFLEKQGMANAALELKKENSFLRQELQKALRGKTVADGFQQDIDKSSAAFRLYSLLLNKYSDLINEFEKKTVGEIKAMVNADDLTVQSLVQDFKKEGYSFEKDYFEAARKAFAFISNEIIFVHVDLDINFWLSPKEIMNKKVGDDEDLAVFLCSLLCALGDKKAEVVIAELENMSTHAFVATEINGKMFLLDPSQKHGFAEFSGDKASVLAQYYFGNSKIKRFLYRFNFEKYEQFV
ncbi:MAG: transglutaminase-like domain-containing protein [archaeon]